jgi:hypothetical protein
MTEHEQAKAWRERNNWSAKELAEMTGYSFKSIYLFEQGFVAHRSGRRKVKRPIDAGAWRKYRLVCAGIEAEKRGRKFEW